MGGVNQYLDNVEWAFKHPNRIDSRLWRKVSALKETGISSFDT